MGYDAEWQVLNSKYFVPQNRERVFIIGHLRGTSRSKIFPLGEYNKQTIEFQSINTTGLIPVTKDHDKLRETKNQSMVHVIGSTQKHATHKINESTSLTEAMGKGGGHVPMIYMAHSKGNIKQRIQDRENVWTLSNCSSDFGVIEPTIMADRSRNYAGKGRNLESPKNISNSLTSVTKDNYLLRDARIRRLTPIECERLQGFPDNWTENLSDTQRYRCMGNAVTVPVVRYIAECL